MSRCWETRGCDEEMQAVCLHATTLRDRCPSKCAFSPCDEPQHSRTSDPALVFAVEPDREKAMKEPCLYCAFFLTRGPRR